LVVRDLESASANVLTVPQTRRTLADRIARIAGHWLAYERFQFGTRQSGPGVTVIHVLNVSTGKDAYQLVAERDFPGEFVAWDLQDDGKLALAYQTGRLWGPTIISWASPLQPRVHPTGVVQDGGGTGGFLSLR